MDEIEKLKSLISEYTALLEAKELFSDADLDVDHIISTLSGNYDWTHEGATALLFLVKEYGAFMLRNALALATVLGTEDGNLGF